MVTQYQLTISASPAAGGTVTPPTGTSYNAGAVAPITATARAGYVFTGWTGAVANANSAATTVTMNAAENITAHFAVVTQYQLTISASPSAGGTVTPTTGTFYNAGTVASITATRPGYVFSGWRGAVANANGAATTVTMNAAENITANFAVVTQYQLTIAASPSAGGTVTPTTGTFYNAGTVTPITATARAGYVFTGWTGSVASAASAATTVTMSAAKSITANFSPVRAPTTRQVSGVSPRTPFP